MAEAVEDDWLELVVEDPDNFSLREACKAEGDVHDFRGNLTRDIVFICQ